MLNEAEKKKDKKIVYIVIAVAVLVALFIAGRNSDNNKLNSLLDLGQKYFDNMEYEEAIAVFDQAIAIEPKCEQAYLGKAKAQYALGQNEQAMETLILAMEQVEDTSQLEMLLQEIQNTVGENRIKNGVNTETVQVVPEEIKTGPFLLNYSEIVRFTNTEQPTIQLEIVGVENEKLSLTWTSDNEECAIVSEEGLVTCKGEQGYAYIGVTDGNRYTGCRIQIVDPETSEIMESETVCVEKKEPEEQYIAINVENEKEATNGTIVQVSGYSGYVYYSGDLEIPEHLTYDGKEIRIKEIGASAFYACEELDKINIPASVEKIEGYHGLERNPFIDCINLADIKVDENNEFYKSEEGVLYSKDGKILLAYPAGKKEKTYTIPKEVEKIYEGALSGCNNLEEIYVEEGNARYSSKDGVLIDESEGKIMAYPGGKVSSEYQVPQGINEIGYKAFCGSQLKSVECTLEVTTIGEAAFSSCNNLEKVLGMENVERFEDYMFSDCPKLREIEGGAGTKIIDIGFYSNSNQIIIKGLENMVDLEFLTVAASAIPDIQGVSFLRNLKTLQINEDIREIDFTIFEKLHNLESIYLDNVNELSDLSWVKDLEHLYKLNIRVDRFAVADLSPLLEISEIKTIRIERAVWDSSEIVLDENIVKQIEELKASKPDITVRIMEN